jgi:hypothetical protein
MALRKGSARRAVSRATQGKLSAADNRKVVKAIENFKAAEKARGRTPSRASISRRTAEVQATLRRQAARKRR